MNNEVVALFDLDGTLYNGHIWEALTRYHRQQGQRRFIVAWYIISHLLPWPLYRLGLVREETMYRAWGRDLSWLMKGFTEEEALQIFRHLWEQDISPALRPEVVARLREHQAQGHQVVLVSGTFQELLKVVAAGLGIEHAVGTPLEMRDGRYTGRVDGPFCFGQDKVRGMQALLAETGWPVDWAASYAYADSIHDLPLLELVGHPVAVHPDERLRAEAHRRGWEVMG